MKLISSLNKPIGIFPLAVFRMLFGGIMFISMLRFWLNGWIEEIYLRPSFHFTYFGFDWIQVPEASVLYCIFALVALAFLCIATGLFYRLAAVIAFLGFTYIELLEKASYLNHYYFVSLVCFILIIVPAHHYASLDVRLKRTRSRLKVPAWNLYLLQFQLGLVYFFAGFAKLNPAWLFEAQPLKIWLGSFIDMPVFGWVFALPATAYVFSWFGAIYDLSIPFLLLSKRFRPVAYFFVIVFHGITALLFPIGMFPYIMILSTLVFFSNDWHKKLLQRFFTVQNEPTAVLTKQRPQLVKLSLIGVFVLFQLLFPLRFLLYPGNVFWTEEGYRFSWRVMLMEKAGYAIFHVNDTDRNLSWEAKNYEFLTPNQEKMMATQPDMILQYAHHLERHYKNQGIQDPVITVESYVSLNGANSSLFIDPEIDLTELEDGLKHKTWILPPPNFKVK